MTNFQIFSLFHQRCAESNNDGSPIDKIHSPATPKNLPSCFAFINARGTCFNMLKMNRFPPRQRKLRFSNSNCPHQWQYQRNDFHSRSGNAQGYMAAHPPSKNSVTGAFYDRVSGENQQIHNNDNYFRCRRK